MLYTLTMQCFRALNAKFSYRNSIYIPTPLIYTNSKTKMCIPSVGFFPSSSVVFLPPSFSSFALFARVIISAHASDVLNGIPPSSYIRGGFGVRIARGPLVKIMVSKSTRLNLKYIKLERSPEMFWKHKSLVR